MKVKRIGLQLPCIYNDEELAAKRDELSDTIIAIAEVEDRKSRVAKSFKEELDGLYATSGTLARDIKRRNEERLVDCVVEWNKPNVGEKTIVRLDTGEMVKIEVMTDDERQDEIEFGLDDRQDIAKLIDTAHDETPPPPTEPPSDEPLDEAGAA